jgi:DNA (cytosine-5)-methyltransferase 1
MAGPDRQYIAVEICAGAGGQALGLHQAGFLHRALIEIDKDACATLRKNVALHKWEDCKVLEEDLFKFEADQLGIPTGTLDLLAGGVPCPPFSFAGKQLGKDDERDLFPKMLDMVRDLRPRAVMIENVRGLLEPAHKFADYRENYIERRLAEYGYTICDWSVLEARDFGVPQLRPRAILVALRESDAHYYAGLPKGQADQYVSVAKALKKSMQARVKALKKQFPDDPALHREADAAYKTWLSEAEKHGAVAPTLVGGSKKHGGADLGPTRAKKAWSLLGVDGYGLANSIDDLTDPGRDFTGDRGPKLTAEQAKLIQGFPENWKFEGKKTAAYRQVGNAFPPPVARAVGESIIAALRNADANGELPGPRASNWGRRSAQKQLTLSL